jgi:trehalose 6-phosphate phosphatase
VIDPRFERDVSAHAVFVPRDREERALNEDATKALERLVSAYRSGQSLVLLLDYDGTLTPIVAHPRLAVLTPKTRALLERLSQSPRVTVGIVSGRSLEDITRLVGLAGIYYAGTGGMEIDLRGQTLRHPKEQEAAALVAAVSERLASALSAWEGAWVERKPFGLTVHYRAVPASQTQELIRSVELSLAPWGTRLVTITGPMAIEVLPADGWTKETAVRFILDHAGQDAALPVYVGDEANDAQALASVAGRGGVAIGVGQAAPPGAVYRLSDPEEVGELLEKLLDHIAVTPHASSKVTKPG